MVISNTSPITNLAAIGQFALLHRLYGEISIPKAVWEELHASGQEWPGSLEVDSAPWVYQRIAQNSTLIEVLSRDLDRGEAESIALALELKADLVLLDEREGRRMARRLGLDVIGVLGILLEAKHNNYIPTIRPMLDKLRYVAGFFMTDDLIQEVLLAAGE